MTITRKQFNTISNALCETLSEYMSEDKQITANACEVGMLTGDFLDTFQQSWVGETDEVENLKHSTALAAIHVIMTANEIDMTDIIVSKRAMTDETVKLFERWDTEKDANDADIH